MKISIIMAVFNRQNTIESALNSIVSQDHVSVELIVIDGGSIDGTLQTLDRYCDQITELVSEPDYGIYDALNKGIALATGDVIGFLHSDDLYADNQVLSRIALAFEASETAAVYGDVLYIAKDKSEQVVRYWKSGLFSRQKLGWGWMPPHPTFYVRRSLYEKYGNFDVTYQIAADYDCILRFLSKSDVETVYIPEVMVKMRVGGVSNRSLRSILQKSLEDYLVLRCNGVGGIGALIWKNLSKARQFFDRPKNG